MRVRREEMVNEKGREEPRSSQEIMNQNITQRYLDKIRTINHIDPYALTAKDWIQDCGAIPPLTYLDIVNYLVLELRANTWRDFKSFRSMEAYEQFCSGWVQDLFIYKPTNCERTLILAQVMHSSEVSLKAWVILSSTGEISSGHCTCMSSVAKTCSHIGALLFKIESIVRSREMDTDANPVNRPNAEVGYKIDYTCSAAATRKSQSGLLDHEPDNKPVLMACFRKITTPSSTLSDVTRFYADLHKADATSVILGVLPASQSGMWEMGTNQMDGISLKDHDYCAAPAPSPTHPSSAAQEPQWGLIEPEEFLQ